MNTPRDDQKAEPATPSPLRVQPPTTVEESMRMIRKLEACEGMAAKLLILRNFAEKYVGALQVFKSLSDKIQDGDVSIDELVGEGFSAHWERIENEPPLLHLVYQHKHPGGEDHAITIGERDAKVLLETLKKELGR